MAKEFYTNGTGSSQTLNPSDESKIRIYDSKADADLDLSNIAENEIIATKAGESEGVVEVVDTVEEDNPNPVSSGAVYTYIKGVVQNYFSYTSNSSSATTLTVDYAKLKGGPVESYDLFRVEAACQGGGGGCFGFIRTNGSGNYTKSEVYNTGINFSVSSDGKVTIDFSQTPYTWQVIITACKPVK